MSRDNLALTHLPYARSVARKFMRGCRTIELEDLEGEAALALVEAAREYDPDQNPGVPFVAFARPFLVRRLGAIAMPEAMASLPHDLPAPVDSHAEKSGNELWSAMDVLTDRERTILIKRYWDDAQLDDLCVEFKLSYRRLTEVLHEARSKLRAELLSRGWKEPLPRERGPRAKIA